MKKRLISLLLAVCMVTALFTGLATTASAVDDKVSGYLVPYTFQAGDTIYALCEKRGIDFAANLDKIGKINNITNYNYMMPGKQLWLPSKTAVTGAPYYTLLAHTLVAGETPAGLCQSYGIDYAANYTLLAALNNNMTTFMAGQVFTLPLYVTAPAPATTPTPTPGGATPAPGTVTPTPAPTADPSGGGNVPKGDTVSYYLAQHVMQYGETVSGICAAMGVNFMNYDEMIRRINKIANYNYMMPGKVLLIPSAAVPTSGSYYTVMSHTIVAGDTVYDLCFKYGLNFNAYLEMIQNLNNRQNLSTFYPGEKVLMPLFVSASTKPSGGGTVPVVTPTPTPAPGTTPAPATPTPVPAAPTAVPGSIDNPGAQNVPKEDTLTSLLIPHVVKGGETVSQICVDLGLNLTWEYGNQIVQLNNLADVNTIYPGKLLLFPSTVYPKSGPYYKVMAHTLVAGDTVWDLCLKYGLNYNTNAAFIQRLNNGRNLATYYPGEIIYMPLYVAK